MAKSKKSKKSKAKKSVKRAAKAPKAKAEPEVDNRFVEQFKLFMRSMGMSNEETVQPELDIEETDAEAVEVEDVGPEYVYDASTDQPMPAKSEILRFKRALGGIKKVTDTEAINRILKSRVPEKRGELLENPEAFERHARRALYLINEVQLSATRACHLVSLYTSDVRGRYAGYPSTKPALRGKQ